MKDGHLTLELLNGPINQRLVQQHAGIVDQVAAGEVVGTVEDQIVGGCCVMVRKTLGPGPRGDGNPYFKGTLRSNSPCSSASTFCVGSCVEITAMA